MIISDVRSGAFKKWTTAKIAETAKIAMYFRPVLSKTPKTIPRKKVSSMNGTAIDARSTDVLDIIGIVPFEFDGVLIAWSGNSGLDYCHCIAVDLGTPIEGDARPRNGIIAKLNTVVLTPVAS